MLTGYDTVLFDLDGVIYIGDEPVENVRSVVCELQRQKAVKILTNDSRRTREQIRERLERFGIEVDVSDILTSGWATARYLRQHDLDRVYVIGRDGLRTEIENAGIEVAERHVDAVVAGLDESITYEELTVASREIHHEGTPFIATNLDRAYPTPEGIVPSTGAIVSAIQIATATEPTVIGKPEPVMFELATASADRDRTVMIGDNPSSDILGAHRAGIDGILFSKDVENQTPSDETVTPDAIITDLTELLASAPP